jgi:hypothetical protein
VRYHLLFPKECKLLAEERIFGGRRTVRTTLQRRQPGVIRQKVTDQDDASRSCSCSIDSYTVNLVLEKRHFSICADVCLLTACILRIPLRPAHLFSEDCINFADALHRFDPQMWHPQPPGYPLFVMQSKLIHMFVPSVEDTFLVGVIIATAIALLVAVYLGRDMFGSWTAGAIGAALLLVNPAFMYSGLTSTIRTYVAVVPLVCAYFCWQLWRGRSAYWWAAALALGVGSGYRPQMLVLLFPLWALCAWRGKRSVREFLAGLAVVALSAGVWIYILLSRFQNLEKFSDTITLYLTNQSRNSSPFFSAPVDGWLRMLGFLIAWNGMAIAGWILFRFLRNLGQSGELHGSWRSGSYRPLCFTQPFTWPLRIRR